ncbi:hypothetical protein D3C74_417930 [compost metagenome]
MNVSRFKIRIFAVDQVHLFILESYQFHAHNGFIKSLVSIEHTLFKRSISQLHYIIDHLMRMGPSFSFHRIKVVMKEY